MRFSGLFILIIFMLALSHSSVFAESQRPTRGMSGYKYKEKQKSSDESKKEKKGEEKKGREPRRPKRDAEVPLSLSVSL